LNPRFVKLGLPDEIDGNLVYYMNADDNFITLNNALRDFRLSFVLAFDESVEPDVGIQEAAPD
jgi:hypothetical protein